MKNIIGGFLSRHSFENQLNDNSETDNQGKDERLTGWEDVEAMADNFSYPAETPSLNNSESDKPDLAELREKLQRCFQKDDVSAETAKTEAPIIDDNMEGISIKITENLPPEDKIYLTHSTDFFPENHMILSNRDGHKSIPFEHVVDDENGSGEASIFVEKSSISPRKTVHFAINGKVANTGAGEGNWDAPKFIIIEPYAKHKDEFISGEMHRGDNFTDHSVKLSDQTTLMVRDDVYPTLTEQQKELYNTVRYTGNASTCVNKYLASHDIPVIKQEANDATHAHTDMYRFEVNLEHRAQAMALIVGSDLAMEAQLLDREAVAALHSQVVAPTEIAKEETVQSIAETLHITNELAGFLIHYGVVKHGPNSFCLLPAEEVMQHIDDPQLYIDSVRRSGTSMSELQATINQFNKKQYLADSPLEQHQEFGAISIGQLQTMQNFNTLRHLKEKLGLDDDEVLILREDGLYLDKKKVKKYEGFDIPYQSYLVPSDTEKPLGGNSSTLKDVVELYQELKKEA